MVLVDTSVWINHLRTGNPYLVRLLEGNVVAIHDFVIGELACGNLKNRQECLSLLGLLPRCRQASHEEVLFFIEHKRLMGRGLGYIDVCLLASATISGCRLWTEDRKLAGMAKELECVLIPKGS